MKNEHGAGWTLNSGVLMPNEKADLMSCISASIFFGKHTTTYKYCFLKSLLENLYNINNDFRMPFSLISDTFLAVYWNLINVHKIPQMATYTTGARSVFEKIIFNMIDKYPYENGIRYDSLADNIRKEYVKKAYPEFVKNVIGAFYEDVSGMIYGFSKKEKVLWLNKKSFDFLVQNKFLLDSLNYYEWLKMIESILDSNDTKIDNLSLLLEDITKREDLTGYKEILLKTTNKCFYCGSKINGKVHVDHVIPWDYLKTDNLWNFVLSCPHCNSSKNNKLPDIHFIDQLIQRNSAFNIQSPDIRFIYKSAIKNGFKGGWKPKEE